MRGWLCSWMLVVGGCATAVCEDLDPDVCGTTAGCAVIYGNPIVEGSDGTCIDYGAREALGCRTDEGSCPPTIRAAGPDGDAGDCWSFGDCAPSDWEPCTEVTATCPAS